MRKLTALLAKISLLMPMLISASPTSSPYGVGAQWQLTEGYNVGIAYNDALAPHNELRAIYKQPPLKVSKDLTQIAQKWANQLARSCKMYHQKDAPFGENMFWSGGKTNIAHAIYEWGIEAKNYDLANNTCKKGTQCYHFTQMVWAGTTDVGCAKQRCANNQNQEVYVCDYFPAGNIVGARPFNPRYGPKKVSDKKLDQWSVKMKMKF